MFCCEVFFLVQLSSPFFVKVQVDEGQKVFLSFDSVFRRYLWGILLKNCILVYNLEITESGCNFNMTKFGVNFSVNSFLTEIMVV